MSYVINKYENIIIILLGAIIMVPFWRPVMEAYLGGGVMCDCSGSLQNIITTLSTINNNVNSVKNIVSTINTNITALSKQITDMGSTVMTNINENINNKFSTLNTKIDNYITNNATDITSINNAINDINTNITLILNKLNNNQGGTTTNETATVRLTPMAAFGVDSINDTAYTNLLSDVTKMTEDELDQYYEDHISSIVGTNSLTEPIPVSSIDNVLCTKLFGDTNKITWDDGSLTTEDKRAYIMQFILANSSNQTRALYITNELLKVMGVEYGTDNEAVQRDNAIDNDLSNDNSVTTIHENV